MYNKIKQKNPKRWAQGARGEVSMSSFKNNTKTNCYKPEGEAQLVPQTVPLQPLCESVWFVSVYSGPSVLMDRQGTDFGLHIPPGL